MKTILKRVWFGCIVSSHTHTHASNAVIYCISKKKEEIYRQWKAQLFINGHRVSSMERNVNVTSLENSQKKKNFLNKRKWEERKSKSSHFKKNPLYFEAYSNRVHLFSDFSAMDLYHACNAECLRNGVKIPQWVFSYVIDSTVLFSSLFLFCPHCKFPRVIECNAQYEIKKRAKKRVEERVR